MKINILTLFPDMFKGPFDESIVKRAQDKGLVEIRVHNLRNWAIDKRGSADDRPYGGGSGMILRVDVIDSALQNLKSKIPPKARFAARRARLAAGGKNQKSKVILLDATGEKFTQKRALQLSKVDQLILIAGHYEGVDRRVHDHLADYVISIGDYVLTGGELPAMVITDAVVRLIPGTLGKKESLKEESFSQEGVVEYPQYTRPEEYRSWKVPKVLLSGNHKEIEEWRKSKRP